MKFKSLKIHGWKQFDTVDIEFHDRLTVLTGANASGKTTVLNLLARHFGRTEWHSQELSTPIKDQETGRIRYPKPISKPPSRLPYEIGEVVYEDDSRANITTPTEDSALYHLNFEPRRILEVMYVLSDRPEFVYQRVREGIPVRGRSKQEAFDLVSKSHRDRLTVSSKYQPANYHIKVALVNWGYLGFGSAVVVPIQEYEDMYRGFENILKEILPEELGFERFSIRELELVFVTRSGEFMIDAVSGGIGALIDLAWQIYTFSENGSDPFIVLIDEVETHLHASMQRELLPSFLEAFPNVQFIVSTHSPLVVSSVRDSSVYVLKYNDKRRVESMALDITNKAKGTADILRDVLGVSFTMPIWVENELNEINEKYSKLEINEETFASLREELTEIGLEDLVPYSIDKILSSK